MKKPEYLKELWKDLNTKRDNIPHLNILWRIILLPFMGIWFLFQLCALSFLGGMVVIIIGIFGILMSLGEKERKEDMLENVSIILSPVVCPFIWLYRYFYLGEYNVLFD